MGPRTLLKCRIKGIRLDLKRVSIITAALVELLILNWLPAGTTLFVWGLVASVAWDAGTEL